MSSFFNALNKKFAQINDEHLKKNEDQCIQFFNTGFKRTSTLCLNNSEINRIGDSADDISVIKSKCCHIEELHLVKNKLRRWEDICEILLNLPKLQFLNLSQNYFYLQKDIGLCESLRVLILNETFLEWESVARILSAFPNLTELHLSSNGYRNVLIDALLDEHQPETIAVEPHCALRALHFQSNPVEDWFNLCRLGRVFPELESLVIANCPVKSLQYNSNESVEDKEDENENIRYFPKLVYLNLNNSKIDSWAEIDRLREFPSLVKLNIQRLPLWATASMSKDELWRTLLKKLPKIQVLNRSYISEEDRMEQSDMIPYEIKRDLKYFHFFLQFY